MTIETLICEDSYVADGTTNPRYIGFPIADASFLAVEVDGVPQIAGVHYIIDGDYAAGSGRIVPQVAWSAGAAVDYYRTTQLIQGAAIPAGKPLPSRRLETQLDRDVMRIQEIGAHLARMPQIPRRGGVNGKFPVVLADGTWGFASSTGGGDTALREDLANPEAGGSMVATSTGVTVEQMLNWTARANIPLNGGDVGFSASDTYGNTDDGASGGTIYLGRKRTGAITPGPAARDRGYGGSSHHWDVRYDDADIGGDFGRVGFFRNVLTGAFKGGRIAVVGEVNQQHVAHAGNTNRNYVGIQGSAISHTGDGGTNLTTDARGSYFGLGALAFLYPTAQNVLTTCGIEINTFTQAGSSTKYLVGLSVASANESRGSVVDAAIDIGGQNDLTNGINHSGWTHGLCFTDHHGADPFYSGSILIGYHWEGGGARTIQHGVDLSGFSITGAVLQGQKAVLAENTLTLGADGAGFSSIVSGNGSTDAHLSLSAKGAGGVRLRDGPGVERLIVDGGQGVTFVPLSSGTPTANDQVVMEFTNATTITFRGRKAGTTKSGTITLS